MFRYCREPLAFVSPWHVSVVFIGCSASALSNLIISNVHVLSEEIFYKTCNLLNDDDGNPTTVEFCKFYNCHFNGQKVLYLFRRTDTFLPHLAFVDFDLPLARRVKTDARSPPVELSIWPHQESCRSVTRTHSQQQRKHCICIDMY